MAEIEWDSDQRRISVTGVPQDRDEFQSLMVHLADVTNTRRIDGISDICDESTDASALVTVQMKRGFDPQPILDEIDRHFGTSL